MPNLTVNGVSFNYPSTGASNWGTDATGWASAVTSGMLQKSGGAFSLTADVNFGASFGIVSKYFTSSSTSPAGAGALRLANADAIKWRNNANSADIALAKNTSDQLTYAGTAFLSAAGIILPAGFPALTGDVTTSAGSLATTIAATTNATLTTLSALTTASALVTVGTIGTGVWAGTTIAVIHGGTGVTTSTGAGNVVLSSSPTLVTPALGTPSALVGTNISGTAANLTAGNVTTNANLTGPITSSGNATSIASQTGTGTTFAMSASPTFTGTIVAASLGASTNISSPAFTSASSNTAATGILRLASADAIKWQNNANNAAIAFAKDTSDQLSWAGTSFLSSAGVLLAAGFPALTGDITTSSGALATTLASTISGAKTFSTSLTSPAFISSTSNPASAGVLRLANADTIKWRNNANGADVTLAKNTSDQLSYGGTAFLSSAGVLLAAGHPALTGDVTTSAGSLATTIAATTNATLTTLSALVSIGTITTGVWNAGAITTTGQLTLNAGSSSGNFNAVFGNAAGNANFLVIRGDGAVQTQKAFCTQNYDVSTVTSGTIVAAANSPGLSITGAGGTTLQINLPSSPINGQQYWVCSAGAFTTVSWFSSDGTTAAVGGQALLGGVNRGQTFVYISGQTKWYAIA